MAASSGVAGSFEDQQLAPTINLETPTTMPSGHVPLQQRVASTSQVPAQLGLRRPMGHEASPRHEQQFNAIINSQQGLIDSQRRTMESQWKEMDCLRQLFDDEKALWQKREADLVRRVTHLESLLHRSSHSSPTASIPEAAMLEQNGGLWTPTTSNDGSKTVSRQSSTSGAPVWNPRPDHQPTRVFPEAPTRGSSAQTSAPKPSGHNATVDENTNNSEGKSSRKGADALGSLLSQNLRHRPSIPGHLISKDYDGIMFKPARMPSGDTEPVMTRQCGSSSSPGNRSPSSISQTSPRSQTPLRDLPGPKDIDPTLKDAGHTPMARGSLSMLTSMDGGASGGDSGSTPKAELERPPLEPHATMREVPKQPSERQDSYFGSFVAPADFSAEEEDVRPQVETPDQDLPLEGPLGLTNTPDNERNKVFLGELDKKLSNVNLRGIAGHYDSPTLSPTSAATSQPNTSEQKNEPQNVDGSPCEVPEPEPPLRFKKSINFGSALGQGGEVDYGKGFSRREP